VCKERKHYGVGENRGGENCNSSDVKPAGTTLQPGLYYYFICSLVPCKKYVFKII